MTSTKLCGLYFYDVGAEARFAGLAEHCDAEVDVIELRTPLWRPGLAVDDYLQDYVDQVVAHRPHQLVSFCGGAPAAAQIVETLRRQGHRDIPTLVFIDPVMVDPTVVAEELWRVLRRFGVPPAEVVESGRAALSTPLPNDSTVRTLQSLVSAQAEAFIAREGVVQRPVSPIPVLEEAREITQWLAYLVMACAWRNPTGVDAIVVARDFEEFDRRRWPTTRVIEVNVPHQQALDSALTVRALASVRGV